VTYSHAVMPYVVSFDNSIYCISTQCHQLTEFRFYISLNTKQVISDIVPSHCLGLVPKKLKLM